MATNIEPKIEDFSELYEWAQIAQQEPINNQIIENFFKQIFQLLEENDTCFASGAFVFENIGNVLFNILTYNKLLIDSGSYNCNDPLTKINLTNERMADPNVHIIGTITHTKHYDKRTEKGIVNIKPRNCVPTKGHFLSPIPKKSKTKFERVFEPRIKNICGSCNSDSDGKNYSEPKGVILYYPFTVTSSTYPNNQTSNVMEITTELLFVKFEGAPVTGNLAEHGKNWVKRQTGTQTATSYSKRREDEGLTTYNLVFKEKDKVFYDKYCPQDKEILEWYNTYVRTGVEFFVSKGLLTYFLKTFWLKQFNCSSASIFEGSENPLHFNDMTIGGKTKKLRKQRKSRKQRKQRKSRKQRK